MKQIIPFSAINDGRYTVRVELISGKILLVDLFPFVVFIESMLRDPEAIKTAHEMMNLILTAIGASRPQVVDNTLDLLNLIHKNSRILAD